MYSFEQCRQELLNYLTRNSISARDVIKKIFLFTMNDVFINYIEENSKVYYDLSVRRNTYERARHKAILKLIDELNNLFNIYGIKVVFLKGVSLENDLYPDGIIRYISDIDILFQCKDIPIVIKILDELGCKTQNNEPYTEKILIEYQHGRDNHLIPAIKKIDFDKKEFYIGVEPHVYFSKSCNVAKIENQANHLNEFATDYFTQQVMFRSSITQVYGNSIRTLDAIDNLIYVAQHFASHFLDSIFTSICHETNPYGPANLRGVFETMLLVNKYLYMNESVFFERINELDEQAKLRVCLTIICGNQISKEIISDSLVNRCVDYINNATIDDIRTSILLAAIREPNKVLLPCVDNNEKIINEAVRMYAQRITPVKNSVFDNQNCVVRAFASEKKLTSYDDTGKLKAELEIKICNDGAYFNIIFNQNDYREYSNKLMRIDLNLIMSGITDIKHRLNSLMIVTEGKNNFALVNNSRKISQAPNFTFVSNERGFKACVFCKWEQFDIVTSLPERIFASVTMVHFNAEGEADYMMAPSVNTYSIEDYKMYT